MDKQKALNGVAAMGVFFNWIMYFPLSALSYSVIFVVHTEYPLYLAVLAFVSYMISFALVRWSDNNSRHFLAIAAFSFLGTGFAENIEEKELLLIGDRFNLTKRELNILSLILTGYTNKQISEKLFISKSTTKFHVRNVLRKMNASNRHEIREKVSNHLAG